jgi:hypothetical protein
MRFAGHAGIPEDGAPTASPELAFLFRCRPVNERQFGGAGRPSDSGVRFPRDAGKRTPVSAERCDRPVYCRVERDAQFRFRNH